MSAAPLEKTRDTSGTLARDAINVEVSDKPLLPRSATCSRSSAMAVRLRIDLLLATCLPVSMSLIVASDSPEALASCRLDQRSDSRPVRSALPK